MKKKGQAHNGTMRQEDEGKMGTWRVRDKRIRGQGKKETKNQEKKESNYKGKNDNGGKAWKKPKRRENLQFASAFNTFFENGDVKS